MEKPELYTAKEIAEIFKINPQTVYRLGKRGEIRSEKLGRKVIRFYLPTEGRENEQTQTIHGI